MLRNKLPAIAFALLGLSLTTASPWAAEPRSSTSGQVQQPRPTAAPDPRLYSPQLESVSLFGSGFDGGGQSRTKSYTRNVKVVPKSAGVTPTHVQVSESASLSGAQWRPLSAQGTVSHVLSDGEGVKTVYVKLKRHGDPIGYSGVKSAQITYHVPPTIGSFRINNGATSTSSPDVQLSWLINGTATHYRVHHQTNFSGIGWQALTSANANGTAYELPGAVSGQRQVYLQIRRDQSAIAGATDAITLNLPPTPQTCPTGPNGVVCSGNGQCSAGQCSCNPDYSGNACQTVCQRCYGAIGNNCGAADGFNFGFCVGNQCSINAGSWTHDECCIEFRRNGPAPTSQQGSCSPPISGAPPPHVCQAEFNKAAAHLAAPGLTWKRTVNTSAARCTTTTMTVDHSAMCNPSGGTLLCSDQRMCCSRRAQPVPNPGGVDLCRCD